MPNLARIQPLALGKLLAALMFATRSGGFYVFSGRFADPAPSEFAGRFVRYFPHSLASVAFWAVAAALAHGTIGVARHKTRTMAN